MNMGGMHITDGATYAPTRAEEPPGTTRTPSITENFGAGKVSLSTNDRHSPPPICASSPSLKPSRIPCLTQTFTFHRPSTVSAARISPRVSASRNLRKVARASGPSFSVESSRSIAVFSDDMERKSIKEERAGHTSHVVGGPPRAAYVMLWFGERRTTRLKCICTHSESRHLAASVPFAAPLPGSDMAHASARDSPNVPRGEPFHCCTVHNWTDAARLYAVPPPNFRIQKILAPPP